MDSSEILDYSLRCKLKKKKVESDNSDCLTKRTLYD